MEHHPLECFAMLAICQECLQALQKQSLALLLQSLACRFDQAGLRHCKLPPSAEAAMQHLLRNQYSYSSGGLISILHSS